MAAGLVLQNKPKGSGTSVTMGNIDASGSGSISLKGDANDNDLTADSPSVGGPAGSLISVLRATLSLIPTPPSNLRSKPTSSASSSPSKTPRSSTIDWEEEFKKKDARVAAAQVSNIYSKFELLVTTQF